nr:MAG TPA: hypothetical protein [Caudoviricetes sp.]
MFPAFKECPRQKSNNFYFYYYNTRYNIFPFDSFFIISRIFIFVK